MQEYCVFRLYGPMASWGMPAVGGDRATSLSPTRSAIIGLVAAALGIKRSEEAALQALGDSLFIGSKQCAPSTLIRDYHTTQVPSANKKIQHLTRTSELQEKKPNTILSSRDYRCDALWIIAIRLKPKATIDLAQIQQALAKPKFALYLGRKSCPLAAPLHPQCITASHLREALDNTFPSLLSHEKSDEYYLKIHDTATYFWEGDVDEIPHKDVITTYPWDEPLNRARWQFQQRAQHQLTLSRE
ncbi:MAG: type I-E CRISPR-associated protein Cas5/CasD [Pseudomonadota bacterium]